MNRTTEVGVMSFSVNLENETKAPKTVKFAASGMDFRDSIPDVPSFYALPSEPQEDRISKTMGTSIVMHVILLAGIAFSTFPLIEKPKVETITIEIADSAAPTPAPKGAKVAESKGVRTMSAPVAAAAPSAAANDDEPVIQMKPKRAMPKTAPVAKAQPMRSSPKPVAKASSSRIQAFKGPSVADVPETLEDIDAPDLDDSAIKAAEIAPLNDRAFEDQFNKIDKRHQKGINRIAKALDSDLDETAKEADDALADLDKENAEEAVRAAAYQEGLKKKNADALAAARAAAAKEAQGRGGPGAAVGSSKGLAENGSTTGGGSKGGTTGAAVGVPGGVRKLEDLRQMPGNPRPNYSDDERFAKQQGTATFFAYISRDGVPMQFKQSRSTGFTNLDSKTLAALKKWRFYPGQEGWVEIPFMWDLRGGAKELSALSGRTADNRSRGALRTGSR